MTCNSIVDCLSQILAVVSQSERATEFETTTKLADIAVAAASVIVAALAVVVSITIVGRDNRLARRKERDQIRERLRVWFAGLSRSADKKTKESHRRLDSRIKEDVNPLRNQDVFELMHWAESMHTLTQEREDNDPDEHDRMHAERMYAKWIFRDALAVWVLHPRVGRMKMRSLRKRGYSVLEDLEIPDSKQTADSMRPYEPSV
ncbi:hypothetical protein [Agreia bicolorata]|uniref:Uncharacterized protein n=1 Tax=Agreia bicolorata TaxID=110935 RepID=A0ABR5CJ68_9MICO|nr:hypothetical protein [Agreia bicolorata]KJC65624.1 hypothetical protein TZ00_02085 [Agreia bicolorata]